MKKYFTGFIAGIALVIATAFATWPGTNVTTTNLDSDTDSPLAARPDLYDLATKFNQVRAHVSTFMQGMLDDVDAAAARITLGLGTISTQAASSVAITGGSVTGLTSLSSGIATITAAGGVQPGLYLNHTGTDGYGGAIIWQNDGVTEWYADYNDSADQWRFVDAIGAAVRFTIDRSTGNVGITGTLSSTKACATNYVRIGPNFCRFNQTAASSLTGTTACTQTSALSGVSDAKAVQVEMTAAAVSTGSAGVRTGLVSIFRPSDTTCTGSVVGTARAATYEPTGLSAGTLIGVGVNYAIVESDSSGRVYATLSSTSGFTFIRVNGYFD